MKRNKTYNNHNITRLEIISPNGREYVNWDIDGIILSYQDDHRTLKIFTKEPKGTPND